MSARAHSGSLWSVLVKTRASFGDGGVIAAAATVVTPYTLERERVKEYVRRAFPLDERHLEALLPLTFQRTNLRRGNLVSCVLFGDFLQWN
jgi:hypothetical protein